MPRRPARSRGFTLVELMVAVTGGLFVTLAVFALSKQSTRIYQAETRIANATMSSVVGFDRLRADIERAGYLVSPNVSVDPKFCGTPGDANWPQSADGKGQYMRHLSSVFITPTPVANVPNELKANGIAPDEITLAGSYSSLDQFPTESIQDDGTHHVILLQVASPAMARLGFNPSALPADQVKLLGQVFAKGRILRIVDTVGREQYGVIEDLEGGLPPKILLKRPSASSLLYRTTSTSLKCGIQGNGKQSLVNVVNFIKYSIKNLSTDARYAPLYGTNAPATDSGRGELVREELDASGATVPDENGDPAYEVIAEFAVDLSFGITVSSIVTSGTGAKVESLLTYGAGAPEVAKYAGETWGASPLVASTMAPQYLRMIHARLGVRSREADRDTNVPTFGDGGAPILSGMYRIGLGTPGPNAPPFARVRTMQSDIALRNHRGVTW
ncbi:MAG TPA: prepilin-type N-terminal cleavage/methylation domain-containing protein [Polyangiaceae bacterium]|nr:prepilin-type N-terminal cleavage/methylation domain-containing protein [Polyangiaceae bacterium]